jgi:glutathione S-transferase
MTHADLVLYGFQRSTYVNVARLLLHAKGVGYRFYDTEAEMGSADHLARHPFGRVPALQHGDFWLYETTAIGMYVEENFTGPRLLPADARQRAIVHQWISNLNAYFYPSIIFALIHERLVFGELGIAADEAVIAESLPKIARCLEVMQASLQVSVHLVGHEVTMADFFLLPTITALTFVSEGQALLRRFPEVEAWLGNMGQLPSVREFRATLPPRAPIEHARRWPAEHRQHASARADARTQSAE